MPTVNIPGLGTVNFPDEMSPQDIQQAIETDILPKNKIRINAAYNKQRMASGQDIPHGTTADELNSAQNDSFLGNVWNQTKQRLGDAATGMSDLLSPGKTMGEAVTDPMNLLGPAAPIGRFVKGQIQNVGAQAQRARDAAQQGDYGGVMQHAAGAVPVVGPLIDQTVDDAKSGNVGGILANASMLLGPKVIAKGLPVAARVAGPAAEALSDATQAGADALGSRLQAGPISKVARVMNVEDPASMTDAAREVLESGKKGSLAQNPPEFVKNFAEQKASGIEPQQTSPIDPKAIHSKLTAAQDKLFNDVGDIDPSDFTDEDGDIDYAALKKKYPNVSRFVPDTETGTLRAQTIGVPEYGKIYGKLQQLKKNLLGQTDVNTGMLEPDVYSKLLRDYGDQAGDEGAFSPKMSKFDALFESDPELAARRFPAYAQAREILRDLADPAADAALKAKSDYLNMGKNADQAMAPVDIGDEVRSTLSKTAKSAASSVVGGLAADAIGAHGAGSFFGAGLAAKSAITNAFNLFGKIADSPQFKLLGTQARYNLGAMLRSGDVAGLESAATQMGVDPNDGGTTPPPEAPTSKQDVIRTVVQDPAWQTADTAIKKNFIRAANEDTPPEKLQEIAQQVTGTDYGAIQSHNAVADTMSHLQPADQAQILKGGASYIDPDGNVTPIDLKTTPSSPSDSVMGGLRDLTSPEGGLVRTRDLRNALPDMSEDQFAAALQDLKQKGSVRTMDHPVPGQVRGPKDYAIQLADGSSPTPTDPAMRQKLFDAMDQMTGGDSTGKLVSIPKLRSMLGMSKGEFNRLMYQLQQRRELDMHTHPTPQTLNADEAANALPNDPEGSVYIAASRR